MKEKYFFYAEELSEWYDPESVFTTFYGDKENSFWLDSSKIIEGFSRFSYLGEAAEVIRYFLNEEDIFSILQNKLKQISVSKTGHPFSFVGGYIGYFGYELKQLCGFSNRLKSKYPDSIWYFADRFFIFDHKEKKVYLGCLTKNKKKANEWIEKTKIQIQKVYKKNEKSTPSFPNVPKQELQLEQNEKEYLQAIESCKTYLHKGESYEICLTNRLRGVSYEDSLDLYRKLRRVNPAPYAAYFKDADFAVLCSSPERFLTIDQEGWVESKPMKGTISRSSDSSEDIRLASQLQKSEKDKAENLMIADLVRNDLGRVCEIGSVYVPELMKVESYQTVHQMISTVRGKLKPTVSSLDCIKACFPGGSMTGAPKKRTIEILDRLEKSARGVYSGALGYLSANGAVDLNIVIRTIVKQKNKISIGVGGAIIYQSDPEKEFEEMLLKAKALQIAIMQNE